MGGLCALLEPSPCEPVDTFDLFYFFHLVFFPSPFWSLALRRKGGIVVDWCSGRTKSSVSSRGGHPSPSRSLFHAFPPHFARAWGSGILFSVGASSFEGGRHICFSFSHVIFLPLALGFAFVVGGAPIQCCGRYFGNMWKRLSATDISALVTMKNVAKCDT